MFNWITQLLTYQETRRFGEARIRKGGLDTMDRARFGGGGGVSKLRWLGGGAQRPVLDVNEPKKIGARSAGTFGAAITHQFQ